MKQATTPSSSVASSRERSVEPVASGKRSPTIRRDRLHRTVGNRTIARALQAPSLPGLGGGTPIDPAIRATLETAFRTRLDGIRIHTDDYANALARRASAEAFTVGRDIVFARGRFDPHSRTGQQLIAHEVAHAVQQSGGNLDALASSIDAPGAMANDFEAQADAAAARALTGGYAPLAHAPVTVMRKPSVDAPIEEHKVVAYMVRLAGKGSEVGRNAKRYYDSFHPDFESLVVGGGTLVKLFEVLASRIRTWEETGRRVRIKELHIVAHAGVLKSGRPPQQELLVPIERSGPKFSVPTAQQFRAEVLRGRRPEFASAQAVVADTLDNESTIRVVSCNVGEDASLMRAIQLFFGGNATVLAARGFWLFEPVWIGPGTIFPTPEAARKYLVAQGALGENDPLPREFLHSGVPTQFFFYEDTTAVRGPDGEVLDEVGFERARAREADHYKKYLKASVFEGLSRRHERHKVRVAEAAFSRSPSYPDAAADLHAPQNLFIFAGPLSTAPVRINTSNEDPLGGISEPWRDGPRPSTPIPPNHFLDPSIDFTKIASEALPATDSPRTAAASAPPSSAEASAPPPRLTGVPSSETDATSLGGEVSFDDSEADVVNAEPLRASLRTHTDVRERNVESAMIEVVDHNRYRIFGFDIGSADLSKPNMRTSIGVVIAEAKRRGAEILVTGIESRSRRPGKVTTYARARAAAVIRFLQDAGVSAREHETPVDVASVKAHGRSKARDRGVLLELRSTAAPREQAPLGKATTPEHGPLPRTPEPLLDQLSIKLVREREPYPRHGPGMPLGPFFVKMGYLITYEITWSRAVDISLVNKLTLKNLEAVENQFSTRPFRWAKVFAKASAGPSKNPGEGLKIVASFGVELLPDSRIPIEISLDPLKLLTKKEGLKIKSKAHLHRVKLRTEYGIIDAKILFELQFFLLPNPKQLLAWLSRGAATEAVAEVASAEAAEAATPTLAAGTVETAFLAAGAAALGVTYTAGSLLLLGYEQRANRVTIGNNIFNHAYAGEIEDLACSEQRLPHSVAPATLQERYWRAAELYVEDRQFVRAYDALRTIAREAAQIHVAELRATGEWNRIRNALPPKRDLEASLNKAMSATRGTTLIDAPALALRVLRSFAR